MNLDKEKDSKDIFNFKKDIEKARKMFERKKHFMKDSFEESIFYNEVIKSYKKADDILLKLYSFKNLKNIIINENNNKDFIISFTFENNEIIKYLLDKAGKRLNIKEIYNELFTIFLKDQRIEFYSNYISNKKINENSIKVDKNITNTCFILRELYLSNHQTKYTPETLIEAGLLYQVIYDKIIISEEIKNQINKRDKNDINRTI